MNISFKLHLKNININHLLKYLQKLINNLTVTKQFYKKKKIY